MTTYKEKLKSPKWQKKRLLILQRDNFTCQLCKDTETSLHVHHLKYSGEPHEAPDENLITYCEDCHWIVESLKKDIDEDVSALVKFANDTGGMLFIVKVNNGFRIFEKEKGGKLEYTTGLGTKAVQALISMHNG